MTSTCNPLYSWWVRAELNCRHSDFQSDALPTELPTRLVDLTCERLETSIKSDFFCQGIFWPSTPVASSVRRRFRLFHFQLRKVTGRCRQTRLDFSVAECRIGNGNSGGTPLRFADNHHRAGNFVMPALLLFIKSNPDITQAKNKAGNQVTDRS